MLLLHVRLLQHGDLTLCVHGVQLFRHYLLYVLCVQRGDFSQLRRGDLQPLRGGCVW